MAFLTGGGVAGGAAERDDVGAVEGGAREVEEAGARVGEEARALAAEGAEPSHGRHKLTLPFNAAIDRH